MLVGTIKTIIVRLYRKKASLIMIQIERFVGRSAGTNKHENTAVLYIGSGGKLFL